MAIDTPATIGVLGAGPIGIEAALYARFLGYDVLLFDQDDVAGHVRRWGHVQMFSPFGMNRSNLGLAALAAQDESFCPPDDDALLTGAAWVERYLQPLANSDLLSDSLRLHHRVISVSRSEWLKGDLAGDDARSDGTFRILYENGKGEGVAEVDVVIDTTGVYSQPHWMGPGGAPAIGERQLQQQIWRHLPDIAAADRQRFSGRRVLVVGSGYSAATVIADLHEVKQDAADTTIHWATRRSEASGGPSHPVPRIANDRLPARDALAAAAQQAVESGSVQWHRAARVEELQKTDAGFRVHLVQQLGPGQSGDDNDTKDTDDTDDSQLVIDVDEIVSCVGFGVNRELFAELQVHQCYATDGPMKLAASLMASDSADCLDSLAPSDAQRDSTQGAALLRTPEPNFYILGAKSFGRNSQFLVQLGLQQIRDLFAMIGDRATLDLYASITPGQLG